MSSILGSPAVVLGAAMAVSGALIFLSRRGEKYFPPTEFPGNRNSNSANQILKSCLSSDGQRRERKKKRVKFAETVKSQTRNGEKYRKEQRELKSSRIQGICRSEIHRMPANRVALYNGILRDRVQRTECSF